MTNCFHKSPQKGNAKPCALRKYREKNRAGFTLLETTIAIAVLAFAMIPLVGLIPTGLNVFHQALDASVKTQIAQRLINETQQTDFNTLIGGNTARFLQSPTPRYFDDQGNELPQSAGAIYQTRTVITPMAQMPYTSTGEKDASNVNLAIVTVQIANSPSNGTPQEDAATKLWISSGSPLATYSAVVANNQ